MLENEIKVINEIINIKKYHFISEYDLKWLCKDFNADRDIVFAILENKYNAVYVPSPDPRYNGHYNFDNPNLQKQDYYILNFLIKNESKCYSTLMAKASSNYHEWFPKEILRLECGLTTPPEDIMKALEENAFITKDRIWFITTKKDY